MCQFELVVFFDWINQDGTRTFPRGILRKTLEVLACNAKKPAWCVNEDQAKVRVRTRNTTKTSKCIFFKSVAGERQKGGDVLKRELT